MHCKSYSHFFSKKFQNICVSLDVNFNESLTNDIVSFEQLGPDLFLNKSLERASSFLIFTSLRASSADDKFKAFFFFSQKQTICMTVKACFLGKKVKMSTADFFTMMLKFNHRMFLFCVHFTQGVVKVNDLTKTVEKIFKTQGWVLMVRT